MKMATPAINCEDCQQHGGLPNRCLLNVQREYLEYVSKASVRVPVSFISHIYNSKNLTQPLLTDFDIASTYVQIATNRYKFGSYGQKKVNEYERRYQLSATLPCMSYRAVFDLFVIRNSSTQTSNRNVQDAMPMIRSNLMLREQFL